MGIPVHDWRKFLWTRNFFSTFFHSPLNSASSYTLSANYLCTLFTMAYLICTWALSSLSDDCRGVWETNFSRVSRNKNNFILSHANWSLTESPKNEDDDDRIFFQESNFGVTCSLVEMVDTTKICETCLGWFGVASAHTHTPDRASHQPPATHIQGYR